MLKHINMIEVPGTSHEAKDSPAAKQFTGLLATHTAPVFSQKDEPNAGAISHVVAVTYRDAKGLPVHGGLFGVIGYQVVSIHLMDTTGVVRVGADLSNAAVSMLLMRGPLVFRQSGTDKIVDFSIVDISASNLGGDTHRMPHKEAVTAAYVKHVLPFAAVEQPVAI